MNKIFKIKTAAFAFAAIAAVFMMSQTASAQHGHRGHGHSAHRGHGGHGINNHRGNCGSGFSINIGSSYGRGLSIGQGVYGGGFNGFGGGYGAFRPSYRIPTYGYSRPAIWHDTTHLDYHAPSLVPHGNHYDYIPGHYDVHRTGHWHR